MRRLPRLFLFFACALGGASLAHAQSPDTVVTRPVEGEAQTLKKGRVVPAAAGEAGKDAENPGGLAIY